ncbi:MAG: RNA-directed DNA polymerase [Candidatus Competibacteraceae bacterium]|nr:RNA-directed DNA polymerase [Candidatus Competibacteraceae bacterium]
MSETPPTWDNIAQVGDIERWVVAQLRQRGLLDEAADPAKLSGAALHQFKARREEERRVRKRLRQQAWAAYRQAHLVHLGADVFHHDTPDQDRYDLPDPEARRETNGLPEIKDAKALAKALELTMPQLRWLAFQREVDTGSHYQYWTIPKRDGGQRLISSPKPTLKKTQRWILRQIAERLPVHGAAHGFLPGRSVYSNAAVHAGARQIIKFDIRHFYPTVTWRRVKGLFRKGGYGEQVATVLALLCTEAPRELLELEGKPYHVASGPRALPQGAPTSPALSNTVCLRLDCRLSGLTQKLGFRYTRYADDLTFSWHALEPPPLGRLLRGVHLILKAEGFIPHPDKTRVLRHGRRQTVTGLVVNAAPPDCSPARIPRNKIRELRAALHNRLNGKPGKEGESLAQLRGWVAYLHMTDPEKAKPFLAQLKQLEARGADE